MTSPPRGVVIGTGRIPRPPVPLREKLVAASAGLLIVFLGWGLGGMRPWTQVVIGSLCLSTFLLALFLPSGRFDPRADAPPWRQLLRFPIFWVWGLYIVFLLCQAANPSWDYVQEGTRWWLRRIDHIAWLPSGMRTPFDQINPWRCLIWMGGAWLFVCALWIGIRHRRTAVVLLWIAVCNAALMAFVGIIMKMDGTRNPLWIFDRMRASSVFGSFYYKNHAAAFLLIHLGICLGLVLYHWVQARRMGHKSNPAFTLLLIAVVLYAGLIFSLSRGGVAFATLLILVFVLLGLIAVSRHGSVSWGGAAIAIAALVVLLIPAWALISQANLERLERRYQNLFQQVRHALNPVDEEEITFDHRLTFVRATLDMWQEEMWTGYGIGSYRFYIPVHQRNYPEIWIHPRTYHPRRNPEGRTFTRRLFYAHSDWAQSLAEVGVVGSGLALGVLATWAILFLRRIRRWNPGVAVWGATAAITFLYSAVEFVFWSPSVYLAFCILPVLAFKTLK